MVSLSAASGLPVTVNYVTTNGTAAASKDYAASSGVLRFEPGETTKAISVAVLADTFMERNETFRMKLNGLQGAEFGRSKATCTIQDAALAALLSESSAIHTPDRNTRTASAVDYALLWLVMSD